MATEDIHVGDTGTIFKMTLLKDVGVPMDVSTATTLQFVFLSSHKRRFVVTAVKTNDGRDGIVQYASVPGDLDVAGPWKFQAKIITPLGSWSSDVVSFTVKPNI